MHCLRTFLSIAHPFSKTAVPYQRLSVTKFTYTQPRCCSYQINDTEQIVQDLSKGDPDYEKKLRILMLEVDLMRQDGRQAPDHIRIDQWKHLMELQSKNQKRSYIQYLFKTEKSKENAKAKKEARRKEFSETPREDVRENDDDLLYGLVNQSLFLRIRDHSINQFDNYRALQAMMHGLPLVIDCSYEGDMVYKENTNAAKQMTYVFGDNRIHKQPFNIHMCNLNMNGKFMEQFRKNVPSIDEPWFPMNMHSRSYLDIFPKEKLVYLTPHCRNELTKFDHDAVYIVGCMVDKLNTDPLSLIRAKRDGIKMAKLPLDRYMEWAPGSRKTLNINHMVPILLDLSLTNDWEFSLRHVPRRNLMETKIKYMEKKLQYNPELKKEIMNSFKTYGTNRLQNLNKTNMDRFNFTQKKVNFNFKEKQITSKRSLYDDDD